MTAPLEGQPRMSSSHKIAVNGLLKSRRDFVMFLHSAMSKTVSSCAHIVLLNVSKQITKRTETMMPTSSSNCTVYTFHNVIGTVSFFNDFVAKDTRVVLEQILNSDHLYIVDDLCGRRHLHFLLRSALFSTLVCSMFLFCIRVAVMCNGRSAQQESGAALSKNSMFTAGA